LAQGANERAHERLGTTVRGKYHLDSLLGIGGMAAVYAATHRNGHRVALKILHAHVSADPDVRARFLREGYVANRVDHPGAVRVTDDDATEDGSVFLVMELLEGETLEVRRKRAGGKLGPEEAVGLGAQLLDVLAAAHAKGIVHRDIKPENLFLTLEGRLKVLDFGIARLHEPVQQPAPHAATRTGRLVGTPAFMPPEQALGRAREIDARTDVWSAGATLFTLVSGEYVHAARTVNEMLIYAGSKPARTLRSVTAAVPAAIASVVDRALAFDRQQRWPDAAAMRRALVAAANDAGEAYASTISLAAIAAAIPPAPTPVAVGSGPSTTAGVASAGAGERTTTRARATALVALAFVAAAGVAAAVVFVVMHTRGGAAPALDRSPPPTAQGIGAVASDPALPGSSPSPSVSPSLSPSLSPTPTPSLSPPASPAQSKPPAAPRAPPSKTPATPLPTASALYNPNL
jgi:serine/threonine protein kinase